VKSGKPLPETTYVTADLITSDTFPKFKDKLCKK
jgi:hypothetical protein